MNLRGAALPCQVALLLHEEGWRWLLGHLSAENQAQCTWRGTNRVGGQVHEQQLGKSPRVRVGVRGDSTEGLGKPGKLTA